MVTAPSGFPSASASGLLAQTRVGDKRKAVESVKELEDSVRMLGESITVTNQNLTSLLDNITRDTSSFRASLSRLEGNQTQQTVQIIALGLFANQQSNDHADIAQLKQANEQTAKNHTQLLDLVRDFSTKLTDLVKATDTLSQINLTQQTELQKSQAKITTLEQASTQQQQQIAALQASQAQQEAKMNALAAEFAQIKKAQTTELQASDNVLAEVFKPSNDAANGTLEDAMFNPKDGTGNPQTNF